MDLNRLYKILNETTVQLRKGEVIHGTPELVDAIKEGVESDKLPGGVVTFDMMPPANDAPDDLVKVDLEFLVIGVNKVEAEKHKAELVNLLNEYPDPASLAGGPSYITVGAEIGDQGAAFQLFALGKVLGLWDVITPAMFGMKGEEATQAAGSGFIMMTGYRRAA
ncbi:hypothetical protein IC762_12490 [Bradyrhizobium genosp. L]|uniref:hypothetical protein n=1 Tax=Bradyrhizobium genosp. L TaxID=83637 RepID=UPI0018A291CF|nr:hypothetical protein [Bradyrhizobium genosp. L]QPF81708.1 hypothetical protein IC762_17960 [Bradyrhizobium genosp. L]QPF87060.1 hypothetical protein IC762_12490 [Bradyrhizobium genosp. L]